MTDKYDDFLSNDDDILASVLEESLRHYNEVEQPLRTINNQPVAGPSNLTKPLEKSVIIDLCESPKKYSTVQSRLSNFFTKHKTDNTSINITNSELVNNYRFTDPTINVDHEFENEKGCEVASTSDACNFSLSSTPVIFYRGPEAEGFHLSSGTHYVYPSNFPVRQYQMAIIKTALFHNTLVSLPTGMGKTFIAAVVMYNFYRWYPTGKVVFMAPTRPLVAQQIEACHSIMGIPKDMTFEMTGNIPPEQRYLAWKKYRVFFLTPQVMANDMAINKCPTEMLKCIVIDEAHRATKDYAYVQVLRRLKEENRLIRIIGLSATPGTTVDAVIEVIQNLNVSRLEFRTEESSDVVKYLNKKDVECIPVKLSDAILNIRSSFLDIYDKYSRRLKQYHALNGNVTNLSKFQILGAKQKFQTSNNARQMPKSLVGCLINDFTVCMSLAYALELLTIYGIKVFYLQLTELSENHKCLTNDPELSKLMHDINQELNKQDLTWSHPKLFELKNIVLNYFGMDNADANSKIIIFCQYRLVVVEIFELLKSFGEPLKPVMFVGQSLKEKGGLPQKKQLEVMVRFKSGDFNVLIATSVAEEGLDIGEVDLIICLEANRSPIKFVQRLGRTGRKRSGKCITLLTEGKEHLKYKSSVSSSKTLVTKLLKNKMVLSKIGQGGPRLVPKHIDPKLLMIHIKKPEEQLPEEKRKKGKRKGTDDIMQFLDNKDEKSLDGFQIRDLPKKKNKKRKITDVELNDKISVLNENSNHIDVEDNVFQNNIAVSPSSNDAMFDYVPSLKFPTENVDDNFSEELKLFNEWQQSCEDANSVIVNDLFFKMLNLFIEPCDDFQEEEKTLVYTEKSSTVQTNVVSCTDDTLTKTNFNSMLNSQRFIKDNINDENMLYDKDNELDDQKNMDNLNCSLDLKETHEYSEKFNFNDLFKSQKTSEQFVDYLDRPTEQSSSSPKSNSVIFDQSTDNEGESKINFENLFKSQRVNKYINDYMHKITEPEHSNDGNTIDLQINLQRSPVISSGRNSIDIDFHSDSDLEEKLVEKIDFDEMFKSQRANRYIEDYMDRITQPNKHSNNMQENSKHSCDFLVSEVSKAAVTYETNENECKGNINFIDLSTSQESETKKTAKKSNKIIDFDELFSDTPNKFIDCYLDRLNKPVKQSTKSDNKILAHLDNAADDIITIQDSPVFKNGQIKKQAIPSNCSSPEFIDITTPEYTEEIFSPKVQTLSPQVKYRSSEQKTEEIPDDFWDDSNQMSQPEVLDKKEIKKKDKIISHIKPFEDNNSVDSDDMDFLFINYQSKNDEKHAVPQVSPDTLGAQNSRCLTNEVKQLTVNDSAKVDVTHSSVRKLSSISSPLMCMHSGFPITTKKSIDSKTAVVSYENNPEQNSKKSQTGKPIESEMMSLDNQNRLIVKSPIIKSNTQPFRNQMTQPYNIGLPFDTNLGLLKACNLLKPGFSLKRNLLKTTKEQSTKASYVVAQHSEDFSPIQPKRSLTRTESTPKVPFIKNKNFSSKANMLQHNPITAKASSQLIANNPGHLLPSSSDEDSDVFIDSKRKSIIPTKQSTFRPKTKHKKKLLFVDDEAEESFDCSVSKSSNDESREDDGEFDSSFIDDLDKTDVASISMTKQYLQSVKSPAVGRGVFKIPKLTTQHYNIDVYSQAIAHNNDSSYMEDSFCVQDASDLHTSSSTSAHHTTDECLSPPPTVKCKPAKRKRILSPHNSDSDDSPDQFHTNTLHKRVKIGNLLDSS
ncbi:Fanconi anemia group M protein [Adelges cooleyi]|uniref:Fanconi anemia group M protein n=1 Tax=Adelges cooleyi TaxID=133065 RepID=UPI00217F951B|nr:Fanconi anemia group M protein [Adelges cooleyi]XP_050438213.1 Fanconi anemia group M protein [Adelges cooleyi]